MNTNFQEEAIKNLANPGAEDMGMEKEEGNQEEVSMPMADYVEEHKRLIALLREVGQQTGNQQLLDEADVQEAEMNEKMGGEQKEAPQEVPQEQPIE